MEKKHMARLAAGAAAAALALGAFIGCENETETVTKTLRFATHRGLEFAVTFEDFDPMPLSGTEKITGTVGDDLPMTIDFGGESADSNMSWLEGDEFELEKKPDGGEGGAAAYTMRITKCIHETAL